MLGGKMGWGTPLKLAVSLLAGYLVYRQVGDPSLLVAALLQVDPLVVVGAVLLYLSGQLMTAWRWRVISERVGFHAGLGAVTRFYFIGMFFNLFGPSTLGGDVVRALYLGRTDGRRAVAVNTVLFDRLSGLAMLVVVAVVAIGVWGRFSLPPWLVWLTWALGLAMLVGWWLIPMIARRLLGDTNRIRRLLEDDLAPFWFDRGLLLKAAWVSLAFHSLQVVTLYMLGTGLGLNLPLAYYFVFHPLVTILSALPVSLAGLGIREGGYVWFIVHAGVSPELGIALGLLWLIVLLASSAVGGLVFLADDSGMPAFRGSEHEA